MGQVERHLIRRREFLWSGGERASAAARLCKVRVSRVKLARNFVKARLISLLKEGLDGQGCTISWHKSFSSGSRLRCGRPQGGMPAVHLFAMQRVSGPTIPRVGELVRAAKVCSTLLCADT